MNNKILYSVIGVGAVIGILYIATRQETPRAPVIQPIVPTKSNVIATSSLSVPSNNVVGMLSTSTDHYTQLLASGKKILGDTQYADATAGITALNDPSSPASQLASLRKNSCLKNDISANAMDAYRQADNLYSSTSPDALGNWNEDMNNAASNICLWMNDAVDWQIKKLTSSQLRTDEQKVMTDLTKARADIQALAK